MKKLVLGAFLAISGSLFSQFDAQLSQYMLHNNAFNPAAAGQNNLIDVTGQHRINMVSMPGGGTTTLFSINSPIKIGNKTHGVGLCFIDDKIGWFSNQSIHAQYAYKTKLADGRLSIGVEAGFVSLGFSGDSVAQHTISMGEFHITGDDAIPQAKVIGMGFDISLGLWYSTDNWYAGASYQHLNQPVVKWGEKSEFKQPGLVYVTGGLSKTLENPKYILKPSVLLKSDFTKLQIDLSSRLEYDNKFWGGLTLRPLNTLVLMAGMNINGGLSVGYAFDIATSRLITTNFGSHELVLTYSFEYVFSKQNSKYRSIRYL